MEPEITQPEPLRPPSLFRVGATFLKLGCTAFGGPAAHVAMMRQQFVERDKWLTEEEFLDLIGAASVIPGPSSTEVAMFVGHRRAGVPGLILAGLCFILPAAIMVAALATPYQRFQRQALCEYLFCSIQPVIIAIVAQALVNLGKTALKSSSLALVGVAAFVLALHGVSPVVVLFALGTAYSLANWMRTSATRKTGPLLALVGTITLLLAIPVIVTHYVPHTSTETSVPLIFLLFLKIGAIVYGSGYVLLVFLQHELVIHQHWMSSDNIIDAVAVGQLTPGPVFTAATFLGFLAYGPMGAAAATVGIFLPAFLFVAIGGPLLPRVRNLPTFRSFLDAVNAGSVALMALVTLQLAQSVIVDAYPAICAVIALIVLYRWRVNAVWLILAGAALGLITNALHFS